MNINIIHRRLTWSILFTAVLFFSSDVSAQSASVMSDQDLVHEAVEDYVLGLYEVSPERIKRSVHEDLRKIGYYDYDGEAYNHVPMTFNQLYDLAGKWNKQGDKIGPHSPKTIEIYAVHDKTASAKLTAEWGIDFMHLSKVDGQWKIMNIMWQRPPK